MFSKKITGLSSPDRSSLIGYLIKKTVFPYLHPQGYEIDDLRRIYSLKEIS